MDYIVITPFFPTQKSFRGSFIYDQIKAIVYTHRYKNIYVFKPGSEDDEYTFDGINVYTFKAKYLPANFIVNFYAKRNIRSFLHRIEQVGVDLSKVGIAHAHVSYNAMYALVLKEANPTIKTLLQHHDLDPYNIILSDKSNYRWNLRMNCSWLVGLFSKIDCHVGVSEHVLETVRLFPNVSKDIVYQKYIDRAEKVKGLPHPRIKSECLLYNGVNTSIFYQDSHITHDGFVVGCIANFTELKDQITLIKAAELLRNEYIKFVLIGSGPYLHTCQTYVEAHGLSNILEFRHEVKHEELRDFYNSLDLFVLPSFFEGLGCVFTEAYACGVPFMACKGQAICEYLLEKDATQWTFPVGDYEQLAALIKQYMHHQYEQHLVHEYDINKLIPAFLNEVSKLSD
ncbi:glycosyltransferase [Bacteroides faecium]|uniref:Glycosyltransferase family 4 protein n=1 Tax=Bacteroides faecium TaxID=2715212 RepID=A0A6H0KPY4_9BACE|nr:glycosyltransferase [Bacteroides faecium]QIU95514.1 glycosyltransferase family 4 protein [Bacteroides faecium]